jgi:glycosyltransferase involved in cell wall biosynthesis
LRFTIITPVFNGMPWLPDAINSVARQRATVDVEHLVLDGGSTDGSASWLAEHRDLGYELVSEPDAGQTDALAKGFARATGTILGWLNADDLLEPGALSVVAATFDAEQNAVMVSGACLFINDQGTILGAMRTPPDPTFRGLLTRRVNPPQPATFFRADAYHEAGGLDLGFDLAMDVDLWLRLARVGRYVILPQHILARYRVHPSSKSERMAAASARDDLRARRRNGMPWRSLAGVALVRAAYVAPAVAPLRRSVRTVAHRLLA